MNKPRLRPLATLQRLWARVPLREQGLLAGALPMLVIVVSGAMAFVGNEGRERTEAAVRRHFSMIAHLADLQTRMLDAETGLRGHLLARRPEFLEPYQFARKGVPDELAALKALVEGEPAVTPRQSKLDALAEIQKTVEREMNLLEHLGTFTKEGGEAGAGTLESELCESKTTMDRLRGQVSEMRDREEQLLGMRLQDIRQVRQRDYFIIAGALFFGLLARGAVFWFFHRRLARSIRRLIENARSLRAGESPPHPATDAEDDLGQLERALAELSPNESKDNQAAKFSSVAQPARRSG